MIDYISKVLYVLPGKKKNLIGLLVMFAFTSLLEAFGVSLVGGFVRLVSDPSIVEEPGALNQLYTLLNPDSFESFSLMVGGIIIFLFLTKSTLYFAAKSYIFHFVFTQKKLLISRLFNSYLRLPYEFHLSRNTASLIKNTIVETNHFTQACLLQLLNVGTSSVIIVVLLLLLAQTNILFLVMILGIILPVIILFNSFQKTFKRWGKISSQSQQGMIRTLNHGLGGIKETRIVGCESYFEAQMRYQGQRFSRAATLFSASQILPRILIETLLIIVVISFVAAVIFSPGQNTQSLASVLSVFAIASVRLISTASQLIQGISRMQNSAYSLDALYLDLKEIDKQGAEYVSPLLKQASPTESSAGKSSDNSPGKSTFNTVELDHITYRYNHDDATPALQDISLTLNKGQSIAFIGKSGAGKTTLVDVILGLLSIDQGDILVDGTSVFDDVRGWQNLIGYIPQSIFLIDDTIRSNIAFGVPADAVDAQRLQQAVEAAQLTDLMHDLPDGLETGVGERGVRLSGGQRQRIGIARALYHEREILVLDEATSALDSETEAQVSEAIQSLSGQKTLIMIAHRLSTVRACDVIYLLEKGKVVKSGSFEEVVQPVG